MFPARRVVVHEPEGLLADRTDYGQRSNLSEGHMTRGMLGVWVWGFSNAKTLSHDVTGTAAGCGRPKLTYSNPSASASAGRSILRASRMSGRAISRHTRFQSSCRN